MLFKMVRLPEDRAEALLGSPSGARDALFDSSYPELDLDKAWHVLHLLITGNMGDGEGPAEFLMSGGQAVGEDNGYGSPRLFLPEEVAAIMPEVAPVTEAELRDLDDHEDLDSVYGGWTGRLPDEEFRYYADHLAALKTFVAESVGSALLVVLY